MTTPIQLRDRFRREVDDVLPDATDDSAALWSNDEIFQYLNEALLRFVFETKYLVDEVSVAVAAGVATTSVPRTLIEIRGDEAVLDTYDTTIYERSLQSLANSRTDDYGTSISQATAFSQEQGRPKFFSFDAESNKIRFYPIPDADDTMRFHAYVEAREITGWTDSLPITNSRHAWLLIDGMKELAFGKLDAETYDPNQVERYKARFEESIRKVRGERTRRRRDPAPIQYGGIPH